MPNIWWPLPAFCGHLPEHVDMNAMAPILCASVTTYRGIKRTGARPGQWLAVIGIGGLGHIAVQYAKAMGLRVAAVDVSTEKLNHAKRLGAEVMIDAREGDPGVTLKEKNRWRSAWRNCHRRIGKSL